MGDSFEDERNELAGELVLVGTKCPNCGASDSLPLGMTCSEHKPVPIYERVRDKGRFVSGHIFSQQLDIHLCRECKAVATRQFAEDFAEMGRTIFRGFYCEDHEYSPPRHKAES